MTVFNKKILVIASAAALGFGVTSAAHAGASAFSSLIISNFQLFNDNTGAQLTLADFSDIAVGDTATTSANLDGANAGFAASRTAPPLPLGNADPLMACVGGDCAGIGQNDFTQQGGPFGMGVPADTLHFARGDALLQGAIIGGTGEADSATASHVAEVQLNETGTGAADSRITNQTEFTFVLGDDIAMRFDFNADAILHALLNQPEFEAGAGRSFVISIDDEFGNTLFNWSPNTGISGGTENAAAFNLNRDISRLSTGETGPIVQSGFFSATTGLLLAGVQHNLSIRSTTSANASIEIEVVRVPEPATLGLLGIGLLGMGAMHRRRSNKAKV